MKHKLLTVSALVVALIGMVGVANSAGIIDATKKLGGVTGGIFRLNGQLRLRSLYVRDDTQIVSPIRNGTKTSGVANPVLISDALNVTGGITGSLAYTNTTSGLISTTTQGAIDELGMPLQKLLTGTPVSATGLKASAVVSATTWKGYAYDICASAFRKSAEITIVFTPTSETEGTYSVSPINVFEPWSQLCNAVATGTSTGSYFVVGDTLMVDPAAGTNVVIPVDIHGTTINFTDTISATSLKVVTTLTRQ